MGTSKMDGRTKAKVIAAAMVGNTLEFYDLFIYGFLAITIAKVFFPAQTAELGTELWSLTTETCAGDCNNDGMVTVAELVTAVGIALDNAPVSACTAVDTNADGRVTVDELVRAVQSLLNGCT